MPIAVLVTAVVVVFADQISKLAIDRNLKSGRVIRVGRWVCVRRVENARGWLPLGRWGSVGVWMFAVAAAIWLSWDGALFDDVFSRVAIGAAVGGASSQLWDRLRRGFVVDFVDFGWWPAFNLADVGIVLGAGVAVARVVGSLIYAG